MCIIEYADVYFYICGIVPHKYKRTAYTIMRPHFKTMSIYKPSFNLATIVCRNKWISILAIHYHFNVFGNQVTHHFVISPICLVLSLITNIEYCKLVNVLFIYWRQSSQLTIAGEWYNTPMFYSQTNWWHGIWAYICEHTS
jgi:hypothetical protein